MTPGGLNAPPGFIPGERKFNGYQQKIPIISAPGGLVPPELKFNS